MGESSHEYERHPCGNLNNNYHWNFWFDSLGQVYMSADCIITKIPSIILILGILLLINDRLPYPI